ncbi:MAG: hypothetical protein PQJ28_02905 [Spirochaetales bacterium]|nr:hypothetical protein [Spirochaetales bacterium]
MMKSIRAGLMSAVLVVLMCGAAFAQGSFVPQGSTTVPFMTFWANSKNYYRTNIYLSNITSSNLKCKVTPFDHDGYEVPQYLNVLSGNNSGSSAHISVGVEEFDIPAHSTRCVTIKVTDSVKAIYGYALIEWSSDDSVLRRALIGDVRKYGLGAGGQPYGGHYPLNNGQPF